MRHTPCGILVLLSLLASAGCVTRSNHDLHIGKDCRDFELYVPDSYTGSEPVPLVLVLHPFGSTGRAMAEMTGFNRIADAEGFIVVYPDGQLRRWRAGEATRKDVDFLIGLLERLTLEYAVDPERIYVTGASNGAHMTYRLLCDEGSRFAAAAVVMGGGMTRRLNSGCGDPAPTPIMIIQGTDDWILPWKGRRWTRNQSLLPMEETIQIWLDRNGCGADGTVEAVENTVEEDGTTSTRTVYGECASGAPVVVYRVNGGGHTWPDGDHNYPKWIVGETARDFNASEVIWEFFEQFSRN